MLQFFSSDRGVQRKNYRRYGRCLYLKGGNIVAAAMSALPLAFLILDLSHDVGNICWLIMHKSYVPRIEFFNLFA